MTAAELADAVDLMTLRPCSCGCGEMVIVNEPDDSVLKAASHKLRAAERLVGPVEAACARLDGTWEGRTLREALAAFRGGRGGVMEKRTIGWRVEWQWKRGREAWVTSEHRYPPFQEKQARATYAEAQKNDAYYTRRRARLVRIVAVDNAGAGT